ncbi:hypothetical protein CEXT_165201 [Caerostris extrusa]|uniref:Uncharacterized protein n=1 Tax=Caerostris extrusa TaxID=172846 RepID=A0AAV4XS78_CAEEX|nr:hypothetical protein CEXT_165201 [Caerostris extrusa]
MGRRKDECTRISSSRGPSEDDSGHDYTTWPIIRWNNWTSFSYHPLWFLLNSPFFAFHGLNRNLQKTSFPDDNGHLERSSLSLTYTIFFSPAAWVFKIKVTVLERLFTRQLRW